jgi:hypothetical protein
VPLAKKAILFFHTSILELLFFKIQSRYEPLRFQQKPSEPDVFVIIV